MSLLSHLSPPPAGSRQHPSAELGAGARRGRAASFAAGAFFLFLCTLLRASTGPDRLFNEANEAYSRGDYKAAVEGYEKVLSAAESAALHYNLGNAYYKAGNIGLSILHYEKSLALDPTNPETKANLSFIREAEELPEPEYSLLTRFGMALPLNRWCWALAGGFWSLLAVILLPPLYNGGSIYTRLVLLAGILVTAAALLALLGYQGKSGEAVVFKPDTPLRVAPTKESPGAGYLQAGSLATIRKSYQDFFFVDLGDGKTGWVRRSEIGKIWD